MRSARLKRKLLRDVYPIVPLHDVTPDQLFQRTEIAVYEHLGYSRSLGYGIYSQKLKAAFLDNFVQSRKQMLFRSLFVFSCLHLFPFR